jgi:hypothetical protein
MAAASAGLSGWPAFWCVLSARQPDSEQGMLRAAVQA